jgi:pentafunctional AROM polypeptide
LDAELARLKKLLRRPLEVAAGAPFDPPPSVSLPIIFTVRSLTEGGKFKGSASAYARLCLLGAKGGAEIIDVEIGRGILPLALLLKLVAEIESCGATVLASAHWPSSPPPGAAEVAAAVAVSLRIAPRAVAVKVVASAAHPTDGVEFQASARSARLQVATSASAPPVLAVAMGAAGRLTRVCNDVLTPVTHPLLPVAAAPGQLTLLSVRSMRSQLGLLRPRSYFLFGQPVAASLSPVMHNAGFAALGLPHTYGLVDTSDAAYAVAVLRGVARAVLVPSQYGGTDIIRLPSDSAHSFVGGGNVTIPLKTDVLPLLDRVSPAARIIGAVNQVRNATVHSESWNALETEP